MNLEGQKHYSYEINYEDYKGVLKLYYGLNEDIVVLPECGIKHRISIETYICDSSFSTIIKLNDSTVSKIGDKNYLYSIKKSAIKYSFESKAEEKDFLSIFNYDNLIVVVAIKKQGSSSFDYIGYNLRFPNNSVNVSAENFKKLKDEADNNYSRWGRLLIREDLVKSLPKDIELFDNKVGISSSDMYENSGVKPTPKNIEPRPTNYYKKIYLDFLKSHSYISIIDNNEKAYSEIQINLFKSERQFIFPLNIYLLKDNTMCFVCEISYPFAKENKFQEIIRKDYFYSYKLEEFDALVVMNYYSTGYDGASYEFNFYPIKEEYFNPFVVDKRDCERFFNTKNVAIDCKYLIKNNCGELNPKLKELLYNDKSSSLQHLPFNKWLELNATIDDIDNLYKGIQEDYIPKNKGYGEPEDDEQYTILSEYDKQYISNMCKVKLPTDADVNMSLCKIKDVIEDPKKNEVKECCINGITYSFYKANYNCHKIVAKILERIHQMYNYTLEYIYVYCDTTRYSIHILTPFSLKDRPFVSIDGSLYYHLELPYNMPYNC